MYGRNGKTRNEKGKEGATKIITRFMILRLRLKTITNIITVRSNVENNMIGGKLIDSAITKRFCWRYVLGWKGRGEKGCCGQRNFGMGDILGLSSRGLVM